MKGTKKEYDYLRKEWELRNTPGNNAIESEAEYRAKMQRRFNRILKILAAALVILLVSILYWIVSMEILG
jgi:hypothetical protein